MARVTVRILGSGDAFGSGGRFQTCILVDASSGRLLIDCGASSLIAMKRSGIDPGSIDTILVSHLHGDHFGGLPFFILDAQFSHRNAPLTVAGPPGLKGRVRGAMEVLFPGSSRTEQRFSLRFVELPKGIETDLGMVSIVPHEVRHASGAPAYALRVTFDGRVIAYSGDTEWIESLVEVASDADLFICEAYFLEKSVPYHLNYRTLAEHLRELDCRRLVVTHMSIDMLRRLSEVGVEVAEDGTEIAL